VGDEVIPFAPLARFSVGGSSIVVGRVRAVQRHFQNDAGWFPWRGISDLPGVAWVLNGGRESQLVYRLNAYATANRTIVRMCGMLAWPGLDHFSPRDPGYWDALAHTYELVTSRGLYLELCCFADAQIIVPDPHERQAWMTQFGGFMASRPGIIPQIANEPFKNGWTEADDPALFDLADQLAGILGHRDFSIGDPVDGDDVDSSAATNFRLEQLSQHSRIVVMHPDRGSHGDPSRWRRWVDHLEGFYDVLPDLAPETALVFDEPMGAGLVYQDGKRDNDPDAFTAAQMVALAVGCGYTYHWMPGEGVPADNLPGIAGDLLPAVPVSPDWRYYNDSWSGAPTEGITWTGATGKLRNLVRGNQAWTVAYGQGDWSSVKWRPGWTPRVVYSGPCCCVWAVNQ
jgi:hypothetical protein